MPENGSSGVLISFDKVAADVEKKSFDAVARDAWQGVWQEKLRQNAVRTKVGGSSSTDLEKSSTSVSSHRVSVSTSSVDSVTEEHFSEEDLKFVKKFLKDNLSEFQRLLEKSNYITTEHKKVGIESISFHEIFSGQEKQISALQCIAEMENHSVKELLLFDHLDLHAMIDLAKRKPSNIVVNALDEDHVRKELSLEQIIDKKVKRHNMVATTRGNVKEIKIASSTSSNGLAKSHIVGNDGKEHIERWHHNRTKSVGSSSNENWVEKAIVASSSKEGFFEIK